MTDWPVLDYWLSTTYALAVETGDDPDEAVARLNAWHEKNGYTEDESDDQADR